MKPYLALHGSTSAIFKARNNAHARYLVGCYGDDWCSDESDALGLAGVTDPGEPLRTGNWELIGVAYDGHVAFNLYVKETPRERALLLTGIARLICSLGDEEHAIVEEVIRQLEYDGMHQDKVMGARLDSRGRRGQIADRAVLRAVLGNGLDELDALARKAKRDDILALLGVVEVILKQAIE